MVAARYGLYGAALGVGWMLGARDLILIAIVCVACLGVEIWARNSAAPPVSGLAPPAAAAPPSPLQPAPAPKPQRAAPRPRLDPTACIPTAQDSLRGRVAMRLLDWSIREEGRDQVAAYRIDVVWQHSSWEVHRRFSEFARFRRSLASDIQDLPPLPSRTLTRRLAAEFLEARRAALQEFCDALLRHGEAMDRDDVRDFLEVPRYAPSSSSSSSSAASSASASSASGPAAADEDEEQEQEQEAGAGRPRPDALLDDAAGEGVDRSTRSFVPQRAGHPDLRRMWGEADAAAFRVRGRNYMQDNVKIKASPAAGRLIHLELLSSTSRADHIVSRRPHIIEQCRHLSDSPFLFIVNLQVPGTPWLSCVLYFAIPTGAGAGDPDFEQFDRLLSRYSHFSEEEGDDFRNARFKIIPSIAEGPMLVKSVVPQKPALLGRKLTQRYYRGSNYVETDVDIASSSIAAGIVGLCRGSSTRLVVDIAVLLQGEGKDELPEKVIGAVRFSHINLSLTEPWTSE